MEIMHNNKSQVRTSQGFKWTRYLYLSLGLLIFVWLVCIAIAPLNKVKQIQALVNADSEFANNIDSVYFDYEIAGLVKEKTYKEALLILSKNDSIHLVVNLSDSTIHLSIKGVVIHQTKINEFAKDKFFDKLSLHQEIKLFSQPLLLQNHYATIVKEPIVVRHAPKDTLEAATTAWEPDTLIQKPAFASLVFEHNIQLILEQDDNKTFYDKTVKLGFYKHLGVENIKLSVAQFFSLKNQAYRPTIKIKLPADELRAVYRALPTNTLVVVKL
jgi:hypothetical protein